MPWDLLFEDGSRRRLYPGEYTIGRKEGECAIVCPSANVRRALRRAACVTGERGPF